ncbi:MAG: hypothetical protein ABIK65_10075 [Candidatus Eisenbacteria bacterium]
MKKNARHPDLLETRFPELSVEKEGGGGRAFRSKRGGEVFRVDGSGRKLTLPVPRQTIEDLFGGLPFPVQSKDASSVVRLDEIVERDLLFDLIDALHEQGVEKSPHPPVSGRPAAGPGQGAAAPAARSRSDLLARILLIGVGLLVAAFLGLSWSLAQKGVDQDRERSIETLLRR